jgi:hypothetical protein
MSPLKGTMFAIWVVLTGASTLLSLMTFGSYVFADEEEHGFVAFTAAAFALLLGLPTLYAIMN